MLKSKTSALEEWIAYDDEKKVERKRKKAEYSGVSALVL